MGEKDISNVLTDAVVMNNDSSQTDKAIHSAIHTSNISDVGCVAYTSHDSGFISEKDFNST